MAGQVHRSFENLLSFVSSTDLRHTLKVPIETEIRFFLRESLCDDDRRSKDEVIKTRWIHFEKQFGSTGFFQKFENRFPSQWEEMESFCGIIKISPTKPVQAATQQRPKRPDEFFLELEWKVKRLPVFTEDQKLALFYILKYLKTEAERGGANRDNESIKKAWEVAKPLLEKYGLLKEFTKDEKLKSDLALFLFKRL